MRAPLPDPCYNCIPAFIQNTFIIIQKTLLYTVPTKNQKRYTILLKDPNEQPLKSRKQCVLVCPPVKNWDIPLFSKCCNHNGLLFSEGRICTVISTEHEKVTQVQGQELPN